MDRKAFFRKLEVTQREDEAEVWTQNKWLNRDNVPLPPSRRSWGFWAYAGFWITSGLNVSGWASGASLLSLGLTVGQAMAVCIIGNFAITGAVIMSGQMGAYHHVGFPMWNRMVWGLRASYFPLINRIVLSFTWCATQGWFGAQCLKVFIGSMAPGIYTMKNTMPASTGMTSADFMCYMLFTLITIPLLLVPPEKFRKPMIFAASCSTITAFSIFIWSLARGHGGGPLLTSEGAVLVGVPPAKGSQLAWMIFYGISASLGGLCAGILNQSDYTRFATKPSAWYMSQIIFNPIVGTVVAIVGIVCTSVAAKFYPGTLLWTPYALLSAVQLNGGNGARAAVFFASLSFTIAQLAINIPGNAVAGGIDLASLIPKYINIRRGSYITLAISIAMCPWALLSGATVFISVMGGYAVFLAPINGLMVFDYFFVHKRKVKHTALYDGSPASIYWYWKGLNWRTPIAWACGVAPMFPGFLANVAKTKIPVGASRLYYLCWPLGFCISGLVYLALSTIWPPAGLGEVDEVDVFGTYGDPEHPVDSKIEDGAVGDDFTSREKEVQANVAIAQLAESRI